MSVSAVVVSHGHGAELEELLPALAPQVDELVVIENVPDAAAPDLADGVRRVRNERTAGYAAYTISGFALIAGEFVYLANRYA